MKTKFIDRTKLLTVRNYATKVGITPQHVYNRINDGTVDCITIDGVKFIDE